MQGKNRKWVWRLEMLLFAVYLTMLCYFLFFADSMGRADGMRVYHYNLTPLKEIRRFWTYRKSLDFWPVMINLFGNVVAFLPFGAFLPVLFRRCRKFLPTMLLSFEFSLCVELIQLVWKVGCFDVDDIFLNTIGGIFGYWIYRIFIGTKGKKRKETHEEEKSL